MIKFHTKKLLCAVLLVSTATQYASEAVAKERAAQEPTQQELALLNAAELGDLDAVKKLLAQENPPSVNATSFPEGMTPLMLAARCLHAKSETLAAYRDIIQLLLLKKAAVNTQDTMERGTALHHAASTNHTFTYEIIKLLLDAKADRTIVDNYNLTPLVTAAVFGHDQAVSPLVVAATPADMAQAYEIAEQNVAIKRKDHDASHFGRTFGLFQRYNKPSA